MSKITELQSPMHASSVGSKNEAESNKYRESVAKLIVDQDNKLVQDIEGDDLFQTNYITNWTISDQHRLLAIDRLQTRTLEYHNNVHHRTMEQASNSATGGDDIVAQILLCSIHGSDRPFTSTKAKFSSVLTKIKSITLKEPRGSMSWVHLFDLSELRSLSDAFDMHPLCSAAFSDLRCRSNIVQSGNGFVVSLCYFQMSSGNFNVQMFKLYCFVAAGIVATFIAELMPETEAQYIQEEDDSDALSTNICSSVLDRWTTLIKRSSELGPLYLFYEIATEAMNQQDSLIEFFSRTLFFFKKKTNLSLSHRKKVAFMRKMHIVISGIQLIHFNIQAVTDIVNKLVQKAESHGSTNSYAPESPSGGDGPALRRGSMTGGGSSSGSSVMPLIDSTLVGREQLPYLYDLQETCVFLQDCLQKENSEAGVLTDAMDSISQLKANNTAMVLSLIATIFLPITFLTGVFGMNFTVHGGFTIPLVNSEYGPLTFYLMCGVVCVLILAHFMSKGWIEVYSIKNYFVKMFCGRRHRRRNKFFEEEMGLNGSMSSVAADAQKRAFKDNEQLAGLATNNRESSDKAVRSISMSGMSKSLSLFKGTQQRIVRPSPSTDRGVIRGSDMLVQEAVEEEARRVVEAARKRQRAQEVIKLGTRNSTMRMSVMAGALPAQQRSERVSSTQQANRDSHT